jgi:FixJ family two-component response regulator
MELITYSELVMKVFERTLELKSEEEVKKEVKDRLTKKELKTLHHILSGKDEKEILEKLNLDSERLQLLLESAKKKIKHNFSRLTSSS